MVIAPDTKYIRYILENKKVHATDFSEEEHAYFYTSAPTAETIRLLHKHDFNVNARESKNGFTTLLSYSTMKISSENPSEADKIKSCVRALLECGADPKMTVRCRGVISNAIDLARAVDNFDFLELFEQVKALN